MMNEFGPIQLLILQPTTFCNIACKYCYLPERNKVKKLSVKSFQSILDNVLNSSLIGKDLMIQWHSGEPLVIPLKTYKAYTEEIKKIHSKNKNNPIVTDQCNAY